MGCRDGQAVNSSRLNGHTILRQYHSVTLGVQRRLENWWPEHELVNVAKGIFITDLTTPINKKHSSGNSL